MGVSREEIAKRRIERMRQGQEAGEIVDLVEAGLRFYLVPLSEREFDMGISFAASIEVEDNLGGAQARDRAQMHSDIFHASRSMSDIGKKFFDDIEAVKELDLADINYIAERYQMMALETSPTLDGLSDEELDELKKGFEAIEWKELNGPQWIALKRCLLLTLPTLLMDKLSGSTSTES